MQITKQVKKILQYYESDNPGSKHNLATILSHGKLAGTGKLVILPVDQGFEHGPIRSFAVNAPAFDPHYHFKLAIKSGLNAYAAPLGMIEAGAEAYAGAIPKILKLNSSNSLASVTSSPNQAITASVKDALRLGCLGVGLTIYPGSNMSNEMFEEAREIIKQAKSYGLIAVIWSYPRGESLDKQAENALDITAYAAHIAALLGAHIIKVKPPTDHIAKDESKNSLKNQNTDFSRLANRIALIKQSCFAGRRLVIFSGGLNKSSYELLQEIKEINLGGGDGSIIGRNAFQRSEADSVELLSQVTAIYQNKVSK